MSYTEKSESYFSFNRPEMLTFLPDTAKTILEVGCGNGVFGAEIKKTRSAEVWGIEFMEEYGKMAEDKLDKVFIGPCEDFIDDLPDQKFDAIYFNDVLEHLVDPYIVLERLRSKLSPDGVIISSIPNMRYFRVLKELVVNGNWDHASHGIMDKTHLRWFTKNSIKKMYENSGYEVLTHVGITPSKSLKPYLYNIPLLFKGMDMKYAQFATVATPKK